MTYASATQPASSCLQHPTKKIDPSKLRPPGSAKPHVPSDNYGNSAQHWFAFGLKVIPIAPGTKQTAVKWDSWLDGLSDDKINDHWSKHPEHEVGFIVGDGIIVLDADSPEATVALATLEQSFDVVPNMTVKTSKGTHHYFKRAAETFSKSDSHSTQEHPDRLDVKTGRAMVILPPSTGKSLDIDEAENAGELPEVSQAFIDAVFRHNGRPAPRPFVSVPSENSASESSSQETAQLKALLDQLPSDIGYDDWLHGGMAIFHETGGSSEGLDLFDAWSSKGRSYKGRKEIEDKWRSFNVTQNSPVTIGTLIKMVRDNGGTGPTDFTVVPFEVVEAVEAVKASPKPCAPKMSAVLSEVKPMVAAVTPDRKAANPLDKFSLRGMSDALEKNVVASAPLLGEVALMGQVTVYFAAPNTGKTLITSSLLIDAIKEGHVDPTSVYYLNMDDTSQGLLEKLRMAEEYNFHMLAEGHLDFTAKEFPKFLRKMTETDQASGVVIILDTLKKFVNLMDKRLTSDFTNIVRSFVTKGGTVIALAHTNKNPDQDGKQVYGGVSDTLNDIDCAYTIAEISDQDGTKVVEFANIKRRGNVVQSAAYSYCVGNKISYNEILSSVQSLDQSTLKPVKQAEAIKSDTEVITAVTACITGGVNTKMKLAEATAKTTHISKRSAIQIIEKYTGTDPTSHRWTFSTGDRGAKVFALLEAAPSVTSKVSMAT